MSRLTRRERDTLERLQAKAAQNRRKRDDDDYDDEEDEEGDEFIVFRGSPAAFFKEFGVKVDEEEGEEGEEGEEDEEDEEAKEEPKARTRGKYFGGK